MTHTETKIEHYITPGRRVHLAGIGGVSMNPLAEVLHGMGLIVQGSDQSDSPAVKRLKELGITIHIGHSAENIEDAEFLIRTAAIHNDNPEIAAALEKNIPVFERAEAWGAIMQQYENAICIAGTHGKTTTTSMTTHVFMAAQADPTVMIGGTLPMLHSGYRVGKGDTIILESCEYRNSFLYFFPTVAVILNVEADHLDFFKDLEDIKHSFRRFAEMVPANGRIIANADDPNAVDALKGLPLFTFGVDSTADCQAANLAWNHGRPDFDIVIGGKIYTHLSLQVAGLHNVYNALAAVAAAYVLGIPTDAVQQGLEAFSGAGRRFEEKGVCNGAKIYDDYAHHPAEIHALLSMAKTLDYDRVICAFQPHTYTRTEALFDDFVRELQIADLVVLTDIYAARETNTIGISSKDLADRIPGSIYCPSLKETAEKLREIARPGDIIITVGAGDVFTVGEMLTKA